MEENVNHPKHYNSHPAGVECIEVIRHYVCDIANAIKYLWRAGLKPEMGKKDADKEIEDLKKALWYIKDFRESAPKLFVRGQLMKRPLIDNFVKAMTGHTVWEIACSGYDENVQTALACLLRIGIIYQGKAYICEVWDKYIILATESIEQRIIDINMQLLQKDSEDMQGMLQGRQVEGIHTAKPACRRETEPEHYDPLNIIIVNGTAFCLSDEPRKKANGAYRSPCEICALRGSCYDDCHNLNDGDSKRFCQLHDAATQEYYREVGDARYSPSFGTIEVVDEKKESELELKRLKEEIGEE